MRVYVPICLMNMEIWKITEFSAVFFNLSKTSESLEGLVAVWFFFQFFEIEIQLTCNCYISFRYSTS